MYSVIYSSRVFSYIRLRVCVCVYAYLWISEQDASDGDARDEGGIWITSAKVPHSL